MPNVMGGNLQKIRIFSEDKKMRDRSNLKIHYAIGLFDMGPDKNPILQLSVTAIKSKLVKGQLTDIPELEPTEYGFVQMQMVAAARRRIEGATPVEIKAFRKGSYIQLQDVARHHEFDK